MEMNTLTLLTVAALAVPAFPQASSENGAKQLFYDSTSGATVQGGSPPRPAPRRRPTPNPNPEPKPASVKPEVTGLMYYVEIIQPSGEALRVNASRPFRSGDRIRFHVQSNVAGRLAMLQSENGGPFEPLFPHPQLRGGNDRVEAGVETVIPMRFDNRPGSVRLLLMMVAAGGELPPAAPGQQRTEQPRTEQPRTEQPRTEQQPYDPNAPIRKPSRPSEQEILAQLKLQRGGKGLKIEVDESPASPARFVVAQVHPENRFPAGTLAVEVQMTHNP